MTQAQRAHNTIVQSKFSNQLIQTQDLMDFGSIESNIYTNKIVFLFEDHSMLILTGGIKDSNLTAFDRSYVIP